MTSSPTNFGDALVVAYSVWRAVTFSPTNFGDAQGGIVAIAQCNPSQGGARPRRQGRGACEAVRPPTQGRARVDKGRQHGGTAYLWSCSGRAATHWGLVWPSGLHGALMKSKTLSAMQLSKEETSAKIPAAILTKSLGAFKSAEGWHADMAKAAKRMKKWAGKNRQAKPLNSKPNDSKESPWGRDNSCHGTSRRATSIPKERVLMAIRGQNRQISRDGGVAKMGGGECLSWVLRKLGDGSRNLSNMLEEYGRF
ncbi:hypothetical protein Acr_04g0006650 [Actinidia rufa]|uniref:Uncharacterized protein n=1 Tax=Actinidia rufa TaxID=165716 RepID=A0A7J0EJX8_9ERIC|nr:hypothetical protein Acr_04g0006650 [Actinidia rufa]